MGQPVSPVGGVKATRIDPELARRWRDFGVWPDRLLGDATAEAGSRHRGVAIADGGHRLDFPSLHRAAMALAGRWRNDGLGRGDVISMQLPNWWEAVVVSFAAFRIGAVLNPLLPSLRANELGFIFGEARPAAIVVPERFRDVDFASLVRGVPGAPERVYTVRSGPSATTLDDELGTWSGGGGDPSPTADVGPDDPCLLLYTSGTSSSPKGAVHTHNTLYAEVTGLADAHRMSMNDVILLPMPVTHVGGMVYGVLMPVIVGLRCVFLDVWKPQDAIRLLAQEAVTVQLGMPVFLRGMLEDPNFDAGAASTLRLFSMGGARVTPADVEEAAEQLGCWCKRSYGLTEAPTVTTGPFDDVEHRATTDGRPIGPTVVRIVADDGREVGPGESGEIQIQAPELFAGYVDESLNDAAFTEDGWFRTGDVGVLDEDGFLSVTGRLKDIIIRGGENISPNEVENLLLADPRIHEVAVVAMPDRVYGERACAFIEADGPLMLGDIVEVLRSQGVASYKFPERLEVRAHLPRNATGKLRKDLLRAEIAATVEAESR